MLRSLEIASDGYLARGHWPLVIAVRGLLSSSLFVALGPRKFEGLRRNVGKMMR